MLKISQVVPILNVSDVAASLRYYTEVLGFESQWDWGTPPTFGGACSGDFSVFFCLNAQGERGTWLSIFVEDVDALYAELVERGAIIKQPPQNFPWGVREMNVADPDGHRIRFSSDATGPDDGVIHPG